MSLEFLLLSECRCGGTSLRRMLIRAGFDLVDDEPLLAPWEDRTVDPWEHLFCKGAHVQRYQVEALHLWTPLAALPIRVILLERRDKRAQFVSWQTAMRTGVWHGHPRGRELVGDLNEYQFESVCNEWVRLHDKALVTFRRHQMLRITYEDFAADNAGVFERCVQFLRGESEK